MINIKFILHIIMTFGYFVLLSLILFGYIPEFNNTMLFGFILMGFGSFFNLIVIALNRIRMPILITKKEKNWIDNDYKYYNAFKKSPTHFFFDNHNNIYLWRFADIFRFKKGNHIFWYSFGDVIVFLGFIITFNGGLLNLI